MKAIIFVGTARGDLRDFPASARHKMGHQLFRVQQGLDPIDWKPMAGLGSGVREIRVRDQSGVFRVIYFAAFAEAVYVLHAFEKQTQRTAKLDLDIAAKRLRSVIRGRHDER